MNKGTVGFHCLRLCYSQPDGTVDWMIIGYLFSYELLMVNHSSSCPSRLTVRRLVRKYLITSSLWITVNGSPLFSALSTPLWMLTYNVFLLMRVSSDASPTVSHSCSVSTCISGSSCVSGGI